MLELRDKLSKGFYVRNLFEMESLCINEYQNNKYPLPYFVVGKIFNSLASKWDELPTDADEIENYEEILIPLIFEVLESVENKEDEKELFKKLNNLVFAYRNL